MTRAERLARIRARHRKATEARKDALLCALLGVERIPDWQRQLLRRWGL